VLIGIVIVIVSKKTRTAESQYALMRRLARLARLLLSALLIPAAFARSAAQDERDLLAVDAAICRAFESGDAAALRRHLDAGFTLTNSRGEITNLAQNLAEVERREPRYEVFRDRDQTVRLFGDAAVLTGITTVRGRAGGEPFAAEFRFTDTYVRRDGRWRLVAGHASRIAAP